MHFEAQINAHETYLTSCLYQKSTSPRGKSKVINFVHVLLVPVLIISFIPPLPNQLIFIKI